MLLEEKIDYNHFWYNNQSSCESFTREETSQ